MSVPLAKAVATLANVLEVFASSCATIALKTVWRSEFEHVQEARAAFLLLEGHAKALRLLVDAGPSTSPSGWPISRAMLEAGVRAAWRMDDENPFVAEARWCVWLGRYVKFEHNRSQLLSAEGLEEYSQRAAQSAVAAGTFEEQFRSLLLDRGISIPNREPTFAVVLKELGLSAHSYQVYSEASERLHGSFVGMDAYSRNLGTRRELGRFSDWQDWVLPLTNGMRGTYVLAQVFAHRTNSGEMWNELTDASATWEAIRQRSILRLKNGPTLAPDAIG